MSLIDRKIKKLEELTDEELELVNWHFPNIEDEVKESKSKTTALGRPVDWYYDKKQREEDALGQQEEELQPLTAEEIEEIRQSAYDEGILQGHNDGFEQGRIEGLDNGYKDGLDKGKEEGYQAGLEQGQEIIEKQAAQWKSLVHQLNTPLLELNIAVEKQLVELAVKLAEAVVGVEVKTNNEVILNTLKESIEALPISDNRCEIRLNPEDFELVSTQFNEEEQAEKGWHIKSDPSLEQGGCMVESRTSSIDRTIKSRIKATLDRFLLDTGIHEPDPE